MNQRSAFPRILAIVALVVGLVGLVVVISSSLDGESTKSDRKRPAGQVTRKVGDGKRKPVAAYVVQNGDTLTSIAHKMGVTVTQIQALNPGVDPQILVSGEKLKLR